MPVKSLPEITTRKRSLKPTCWHGNSLYVNLILPILYYCTWLVGETRLNCIMEHFFFLSNPEGKKLAKSQLKKKYNNPANYAYIHRLNMCEGMSKSNFDFVLKSLHQVVDNYGTETLWHPSLGHADHFGNTTLANQIKDGCSLESMDERWTALSNFLGVWHFEAEVDGFYSQR